MTFNLTEVNDTKILDVDYYNNVYSYEDLESIKMTSSSELWSMCNLTRPSGLDCCYGIIFVQKDIFVKNTLTTGIFQTVTIIGNNTNARVWGNDEDENSYFIVNNTYLFIKNLQLDHFHTAVINNGVLYSSNNFYHDNHHRW